jgi:hypothetical protein
MRVCDTAALQGASPADAVTWEEVRGSKPERVRRRDVSPSVWTASSDAENAHLGLLLRPARFFEQVAPNSSLAFLWLAAKTSIDDGTRALDSYGLPNSAFAH